MRCLAEKGTVEIWKTYGYSLWQRLPVESVLIFRVLCSETPWWIPPECGSMWSFSTWRLAVLIYSRFDFVQKEGALERHGLEVELLGNYSLVRAWVMKTLWLSGKMKSIQTNTDETSSTRSIHPSKLERNGDDFTSDFRHAFSRQVWRTVATSARPKLLIIHHLFRKWPFDSTKPSTTTSFWASF